MDLQSQAEEFRHAYGVDNSRENDQMQLRLIWEEFHEFEEAHLNLMTHTSDAAESPESLALKELADLVYVCFQYAENMEWDLEEALDRVHKSNKLGVILRNSQIFPVLENFGYCSFKVAILAIEHVPAVLQSDLICHSILISL